MTKFLDAKFSSRPATKAYRDNFDKVFGKDKPHDCGLGSCVVGEICQTKAAQEHLAEIAARRKGRRL